jgi:hypothetical protein
MSTKHVGLVGLMLLVLCLPVQAQQRTFNDDMNDPVFIIAIVLGLAAVLAIYFLPTIVARAKKHPNRRAIFWVNLLLGWSGVGWFVAMLWAIVG